MKRHLTATLLVLPSLLFGNVLVAKTLTLTLEDITTAALKNNLGLQIERLSPQIEKENLVAEEAAFDTSFIVDGSTGLQNTKKSLADEEIVDYGVSTGLEKKFQYGTDVSATLDYTEKETEQLSLVSEGDNAAVTLVVSQPLLKNRGTEVNRRLITLAENELSTANLSLKQTIIDTVAEAQNLYWNYYYALAYLEVQKGSLALAERSLDEIEERIRLGSSPKLDLLQAKAEVASREESVISADNTLFNAQDQLLNYIYGSIITSEKIEPGDPPALHVVEEDEAELLEQAFSLRTDYQISKIQLASADTDITYYDNQRLPQLDLSATLVANDGQADDVTGSYNYESDIYEDYQYAGVELSLELPIGRRFGNANHAAAILKKRQYLIDQQNTQSQIRVEVRAALRDMRAAYKRYRAAALSNEYAVESLATEEEKYRSGLSTSYQVMLFQRDLTDARATEIDAISDYQTAIIDLYQSVGTTLEQNNIKIQEVVQ